jgi:broad-specificity NMP kinase
MVIFGQLVIGPPGAGKTTYCRGMHLFALSLGRKCDIINLDFANDVLPYTPAIDVRELVSQEVILSVAVAAFTKCMPSVRK